MKHSGPPFPRGDDTGSGGGGAFGLGGGHGMPERPLDDSDVAAAAAASGSGEVGPEGLPRVDAVEVAAARERLSRTAADLRTVAAGLWSVGSDDLAALVSHLDVVRSGVDIATVLATRDAAQRGEVSEAQQASEGQWVRAQVLWLERAAAALASMVER